MKVVHLDGVGEVSFSPNHRSKNIKLRVKSDGSVWVSFPYCLSEAKVVAFVDANIAWICEQQKKLKTRRTRLQPGTAWKTRFYDIHFVKGSRRYVHVEGRKVTLELLDWEAPETLRLVENTMESLYRSEARQILPARLEKLAEQHGFRYRRVSIRSNRSNWGSCSASNNISLNLRMMKLPDHLIDYILLHELVHTRVKNHGPEFWALLDTLTDGRARELAKEVRQYSTALF